MEKTVCELEEDSEIKNKFIDKLKREHKLFVEEAVRNEEELNRLVEEQNLRIARKSREFYNRQKVI